MTNQEKPANKSLFNNSHDLLLHEACAVGDDMKLEELSGLIRGGKIDVSSRDEEWGERTAMHVAALRGTALLSAQLMNQIAVCISDLMRLKILNRILTHIITKCCRTFRCIVHGIVTIFAPSA